ncbi:hypothetical protein RRF57_009795 [Xylaria bambusicola]|uniref:Tc1-like transposase DDE domain-containing protein n=1 Tax=Xylaria bambusicola TaxID=326684 RepID=A0AAN7UW80_9PEZI
MPSPSPPSPSTPVVQRHRKHTDTTKKTELLTLKKFRDTNDLPYSNEDLFKYVGVNRRTGYRILKDHPRRLHDNPVFKETRGRPAALTEAQIDQLVAFLKAEGYEGRALPWANLCDAAGLEFPSQSKPPTTWTIRKHLNRRGWKKCVTCNKFWVDYNTASLREAFAREALANHGLNFTYWRRIRYSDEVHFKFGPEGKVNIIRQRGERYCIDCIHHRQRPTEAEDRQVCLSAWAAIGWNFKSQLVWYTVNDGNGNGNGNGAITLQAYRDQILEPVVKKWIDEGHDFILEENGASGHGGNSDNNIVRQWKEKNGSKYFFNCPGAPDLAPIENAWRAPKGQVKRQAIWDVAALRTAAEKGWEKLSQETINKWVDEVPERLLDIINAKG